MPRLIESQIGNLLPGAMIFAMPVVSDAAPTVSRLTDGSLIMSAVPLVADMDMIYLGYELPLERLFGVSDDSQWDRQFIGRLTMECAEAALDQFEGLALVDGHITVEPGRRDEVAIGTFLQNATLDGNLVRTKALVYAASSIVKIDANGSELSIGGMAYMEANPERGAQGEPDFFIHRIDLNHVALVENGRAGPDARLLNHRASLAHKQKEIPQMKVTINGVEIEVPDVAVNHFSAQISDLQAQVTSLTASSTELTNAATVVTAERDTAVGALAAAQAELTTANTLAADLANAAPDVTVEATRIANEHSVFATEATQLGSDAALTLGDYDRSEIMRTVLNARGANFDETANADMLKGAWNFALTNVAASARAAIDPIINGAPAKVATNVAEGAISAVNNSYFGGKKKEA